MELDRALQLLISGSPVGHFEVALGNLVVNLGRLWIDLQGTAVGQQGLREFLLLEVTVSVSDKLLLSRVGVTETSGQRSEEHTSELQSQSNLVCRLLLEKKKYRPIRCAR